MKIIVVVFRVRTLNYSHEYLQSGCGRECSNILFNSKRFCLKVEGGVRKLSAGRKQREEGGDRRVISLPVTPTEGDYLNINTNQYLIFLSESKTFGLYWCKV